jgi:transcriptional regulator with XRE-family HTH domain
LPTIAVVRIDGEKLKRLRQKRLLSREELAHKASTHRDHIGRLERNEISEPQMRTIRNLAAALEVDPSEFLED